MFLLSREHVGSFNKQEEVEDSTEPLPCQLDWAGKHDGLVKMEPINSSRTLGKSSNGESGNQVRFKSLKSQDSFRSFKTGVIGILKNSSSGVSIENAKPLKK